MLAANDRGISADQVDLKDFDPEDRLAREVCHHLNIQRNMSFKQPREVYRHLNQTTFVLVRMTVVLACQIIAIAWYLFLLAVLGRGRLWRDSLD